MSRTEVGLLITVASGLALFGLACAPVFFSRFGVYRTVLAAAAIDLLACAGLALTTDRGWIVVCFALFTLLVPISLFGLDMFLENKTTDEEATGNIRGIYLSVATLAALVAPVLAGFIAGDGAQYENVYLVSALFLLPFLLVVGRSFRMFRDPTYRVFTPFRTLRSVLHDGNIFHIAAAQFLMRFYFAWMVIYLPIYLHEQIGFSWPDIGIVLFLMLIPYILVEWPAGMLADGWLGEKELLGIGFALTAVATAVLVLLHTPSIVLWGVVLFVTRVGTALIESMTETYFFKHVDGDDTDMIGFFRMLRPFAYTVGPLLATLTLLLSDLRHLWLVLAAIMTLGILHARALIDTR